MAIQSDEPVALADRDRQGASSRTNSNSNLYISLLLLQSRPCARDTLEVELISTRTLKNMLQTHQGGTHQFSVNNVKNGPLI